MHLVPPVGTTFGPQAGANDPSSPGSAGGPTPAPRLRRSGPPGAGLRARLGGAGQRSRPRSPGDALLRDDPGVRRHLRRAALAAGPLAVLVALQGFALAALVVGVAQRGAFVVPSAVVLVGAAAARGIAGWALERSGRRAASAAISRLQETLARNAATLAVTAPGALRPGEVAADVVQQLPAIETYVGRFLSARPTAAATTLVVLVAIATTDLLSAALLAPTVPLLIVFLWLVGSEAGRAAEQRLASLQLLGAHLLDVLRGIVDLRAHGRAAHQRSQVALAADHYRRGTMATLRAAFLSGLVLELVAMLGTALVAVFGGVRLAGGSAQLAAILPALVLAPELYAPLRRLGAGYHDAADARAALDRLATVAAAAAAAPVPGNPSGPPAPRPAGASIRLHHVTVEGGAVRGERVHDVSLVLEPGRTTALVGPSGAGKSTIAQLVLGLLAPTTGTVAAGRTDLATVSLDGWRRRCAWVAQDPVLLPATLRENARLGAPDATDARIMDALLDAGLGPLTAALRGGLDAVLGAGGLQLSSGELRRLALARALIADAELVVLDEPTAQLDALTADRISDAMLTLTRGRTVLLITHDPALAARADGIVELDGGRVVATTQGPRSADRRRSVRYASGQPAPVLRGAPTHDRGATSATSSDRSAPSLRRSLRLLAAGSDRTVRRQFARAVALGAISATAAVAVLALSGGLIVQASRRPPVLELTMVIVLVRLFSILRATTRYGERLASHEAALRVLASVRTRVFAWGARQVPGAGMAESALLDRAVGDVDRAADLIVRVLVPACSALVAVGVGVTLAGLLDLHAAAVIAGGCLLVGLLAVTQAWRAGKALALAEHGRAALTAELTTALAAGPELLLAGRTEQQIGRIADHARPLAAAAAVHGTRNAALSGLVGTGAAGVSVLAALALSGAVSGGRLDGAIAAGLVLGALACAERLDGLVEAALSLPAAEAATGRLAPALLHVDRPDPASQRLAEPAVNTLQADAIRVGRGDRAIVADATLEIGPSEVVLLTGESGAGKSTLLLTLAGLLPAEGGTVAVGGVPIGSLSEERRASQVLLVPSSPHLFGGTLGANLRLADPLASDAQLTAALEAVGLGTWLAALPAGFDTHLGEGGVEASGGERQRLGLARAALSPAALVLLDEPASHLPQDAATAALRAVLAAHPGRAALLVSHRAPERLLASRELRLERGVIGPAPLSPDRDAPLGRPTSSADPAQVAFRR